MLSHFQNYNGSRILSNSSSSKISRNDSSSSRWSSCFLPEFVVFFSRKIKDFGVKKLRVGGTKVENQSNPYYTQLMSIRVFKLPPPLLTSSEGRGELAEIPLIYLFVSYLYAHRLHYVIFRIMEPWSVRI